MTDTPNLAGIVGNLVGDPELRTSKAGKSWCSFRLAVRPYVAGVAEQPEPVYYSAVAFGSLAEHVCERLHQGDRVAVVGKVEDDSWTGQDGVEHEGQKILAEGVGPDLRFAGPKVARTQRTPVPVGRSTYATEPARKPLMDRLLGPEHPVDYSEVPF